MLIRILSLFTFGLMTTAAKAATLEELKAEIAGTGGRQWIVKDRSYFKGAGAGCAEGESYRFLPNGQAERTVCQNRRFVTTRLPYTLRRSPQGEALMTLQLKLYIVEIRGVGPQRRLRLQSADNTSKISSIEEILMTPAGR